MQTNTKVSVGQYKTFTGWGNYQDNALIPLTVGITPVVFTVNSNGSETYNDQLPSDSIGVPLWDSSINKIHPINLNDAYDLRIIFEVTSRSSVPVFLNLVLDIGTESYITLPEYVTTIELNKTLPYTKSYSMPVFVKDVFFENKGQIFLSTDSGSITISARSIFIKRDHKGF